MSIDAISNSTQWSDGRDWGGRGVGVEGSGEGWECGEGSGREWMGEWEKSEGEWKKE